MKHLILVAIMLFALTNTKATAQGSGLSHPVNVSQDFKVWQQFEASVYVTTIKTMNGLGFTPLVWNDTDATMQLNPIVYVQSDLVTAHETDSARNYSVLGFYYTLDKWSRLDTIQLKHANYFAGQLLKIQAVKSTNDSTIIIPDTGTINGASTYWWVGATSSYKRVEIFFDGTNYFVK